MADKHSEDITAVEPTAETVSEQEQTEAMEQELERRLKDIFLNGLSAGTIGTCRVVLDIIHEENKSGGKKLKIIQGFCEKALEEHTGNLDDRMGQKETNNENE